MVLASRLASTSTAACQAAVRHAQSSAWVRSNPRHRACALHNLVATLAVYAHRERVFFLLRRLRHRYHHRVARNAVDVALCSLASRLARFLCSSSVPSSSVSSLPPPPLATAARLPVTWPPSLASERIPPPRRPSPPPLCRRVVPLICRRQICKRPARALTLAAHAVDQHGRRRVFISLPHPTAMTSATAAAPATSAASATLVAATACARPPVACAAMGGLLAAVEPRPVPAAALVLHPARASSELVAALVPALAAAAASPSLGAPPPAPPPPAEARAPPRSAASTAARERGRALHRPQERARPARRTHAPPRGQPAQPPPLPPRRRRQRRQRRWRRRRRRWRPPPPRRRGSPPGGAPPPRAPPRTRRAPPRPPTSARASRASWTSSAPRRRLAPPPPPPASRPAAVGSAAASAQASQPRRPGDGGTGRRRRCSSHVACAGAPRRPRSRVPSAAAGATHPPTPSRPRWLPTAPTTWSTAESAGPAAAPVRWAVAPARVAHVRVGVSAAAGAGVLARRAHLRTRHLPRVARLSFHQPIDRRCRHPVSHPMLTRRQRHRLERPRCQAHAPLPPERSGQERRANHPAGWSPCPTGAATMPLPSGRGERHVRRFRRGHAGTVDRRRGGVGGVAQRVRPHSCCHGVDHATSHLSHRLARRCPPPRPPRCRPPRARLAAQLGPGEAQHAPGGARHRPRGRPRNSGGQTMSLRPSRLPALAPEPLADAVGGARTVGAACMAAAVAIGSRAGHAAGACCNAPPPHATPHDRSQAPRAPCDGFAELRCGAGTSRAHRDQEVRQRRRVGQWILACVADVDATGVGRGCGWREETRLGARPVRRQRELRGHRHLADTVADALVPLTPLSAPARRVRPARYGRSRGKGAFESH